MLPSVHPCEDEVGAVVDVPVIEQHLSSHYRALRYVTFARIEVTSSSGMLTRYMGSVLHCKDHSTPTGSFWLRKLVTA